MDACLATEGLTRTGALTTYRERTWASVASAPTTGGTVWLKTMPPGRAFEVRLYEVLTSRVPDAVLRPLGLDTAHGWLLMPDAGPSLHERRAGDLAESMASALAAYARVQQVLAPHVEEVLAAGVTDMRPDVLPERFDAALHFARDFAQHAGDPDSTLPQLNALRNTFADWCAELVATGRPASIDHNDLHAGNIVGSASEPVFYDWGDAVVAHPFACLLTVGDTIPAPAFERVRDVYLAQYGAPAALRAEAGLACLVALVARAHVWLRALGPDPHLHAHAHAPFAHLRRLLG